MADQTVTLRIQTRADGTEQVLQQTGAGFKALGTEAQRAGAQAQAGFGRVRQGAQTAGDQIRIARQQLLGLAGITLGAGMIRQLAQQADAWTNLNSKIGLVTDSQAEANAVLDEVFGIAQRTRSELSATGELYTRLARATAGADLSQRDLLQVTETINQAFIVSGASAQEATNAIIQLSQGLAAGALRGEEFNSVSEQAPILMDLLGKALGKTRGELRAFAAEGGITTEVITGALLAGAQDVQVQFDGMAVTIGGASTQLSNAAARFVGEASDMSSAASATAGSIAFVARNFDGIAAVALSVGAIFGVRLVAQLGASAVAWGANSLQVVAYNASLLRLSATSPVVATGLRGVTVAAAGLSAVLGPITLIAGAVATVGFLLARAYGEQEQALRAPIDSLSDYTDQLEQAAARQRALDAGLDAGAAERLSLVEATEQNIVAIRDQIAVNEQFGLSTARLNDLIAESEAELRRHTDALAENARWIDAAAQLRDEAAKSNAEFTKSLTESAQKLELERVELQQGVRARLVLEALRATGAKSVEDLDAKTRELIDTVVSETQAVEGLKDARRQADRDMRTAKREADQARKAAADFRDETAKMAAELAGPAAQAQTRFNLGLAESSKLLEAGTIDIVDFGKRLGVLTDARARDLAEIARQRAPIDEMLDDLKFEAELIGLSNTEREVAIALRQIEQDAIANGQTLNDAQIEARKEEVAALIRSNDAQRQAVEIAQQAAQDYESAWQNATDSVARAFGDFVTRGIKSFRDLGRTLKDIARAFLSDLVAMFLRNQLTLRVGGGGGLASLLGFSGPAGASSGGSPFSGVGPLRSFGNQGGFTNTLGSIFGQNSSGTFLGGLGAAAQSAAVGSLIGGLFGGKGSTGGALGGALGSAVGGPIGAAIGSVLGGAIGSIFGRKFKTTGTGAEVTVGPGGASGFEFEDQKKKGGLFGKTKRRTLTSDLDPEAQAAIDDLFNAINQSVAAAAASLSVDVPQIITGSFRREFDKKGNLTREFSTIAGRVVEETQEAFAKRLQAENLIAVVDAALGGSEASRLAEQFRGNADKLLGGASFLLAASVDMRSGFNLLTDGTLTEITALTQQLNVAGEPLVDTYARLVTGTRLLEEALELSGVSVDRTREQFVTLANDIVIAAGGLDRATSLWQDFFTRFFSDNERATQAVTFAQRAAQKEFGDIGLNASDFASAEGLLQFRALFEELLPSLSADAVVQWLEAAQALGNVIDAQDVLNEILARQAEEIESEAARLREAFAELSRAISGVRDSIAADILSIRRAQPGFSEVGFQAGRIADLRTQLGGATDPRQQVALIDQIREATISRHNAEIAAIQQTQQAQQAAAQEAQRAIEAQREALRRLGDFADSLGLASTSPLTAFQRLDEARRIFDQTLAAARRGDLDAIGNLSGAASSLLTENRAVFGVSDRAVSTFNEVQQALRSVAGQGARGAASFSAFEAASIDTAQQIAALQSSAIAELQALDDQLAALGLMEEADVEGTIQALRDRFTQADKHQEEIVRNILPIGERIEAGEAVAREQLAELREQTAALSALAGNVEDQTEASIARMEQLAVELAGQEQRVNALIERLGRAIERQAEARVRA